MIQEGYQSLNTTTKKKGKILFIYKLSNQLVFDNLSGKLLKKLVNQPTLISTIYLSSMHQVSYPLTYIFSNHLHRLPFYL